MEVGGLWLLWSFPRKSIFLENRRAALAESRMGSLEKIFLVIVKHVSHVVAEIIDVGETGASSEFGWRL